MSSNDKAQRLEEVNVDDEMTVLVREGRDGKVIGRLADGRVILFPKETTFQINSGDTVMGKVVYVTTSYIIVEPQRVLGDTFEAMMQNLNNVADSGYYQHAVLAKGLLYVIRRMASEGDN